MSQKSISSRIGAGQAKKRKSRLQPTKRIMGQSESPASSRAFVVLGAIILAFCTIGALAAWRGISSRNASNDPSGANAPTVPMPGATPPILSANAPSKEFIYAGSALLATSEAFRNPPDDIAVWRPGANNSASTWLILGTQQTTSFTFGAGDDKPITRDFDGDGKTDFCVYRPSAGQWFIIKSSDGVYYSVTFGVANTDVPAPADYDGDGKTDIAVFRPSNGTWYSIGSLNNANNTLTSTPFGQSGDQPEAADYDGDGKSDIAVWRPSAAAFYVRRSSDGGYAGYSIGANGDRPVIGDYDGDGKADYATWRSSDGYWRIHYSATDTLGNILFGIGADVPVPGNYSDGDAKTDVAVWRPSNGTWYIQNSNTGVNRMPVQWGQAGDIPVPAPFKR